MQMGDMYGTASYNVDWFIMRIMNSSVQLSFSWDALLHCMVRTEYPVQSEMDYNDEVTFSYMNGLSLVRMQVIQLFDIFDAHIWNSN